MNTFNTSFNNQRHQQGITIIEIMIATALSLIILAGVMHIFINNKKTYQVQEAFARLQESGRFAMQFITEDLRMAGYIGCGGKIDNPENISDLYPPPNGDGVEDEAGKFNGSGIQGYQTADLPIALTDTVNLTAADVVPGTDIVQITRAASTGVHLKGNLTSVNANIQLDATSAAGVFQNDDYLFISDCEAADIFVANNVSTSGTTTTIAHPESVNKGVNLSKPYQEDAEVFKLLKTTYYVAYNIAGEPALFRQTLGNGGSMTSEELVDGIEDMQLLYGEDSDDDGTPNKYLTSTNVTDMSKVVSVRVSIQVRSLQDNIASKLSSYGDKRLRRSFITSIAIRNRII